MLALWSCWEHLGIYSIIVGTLCGALVEVSLVGVALHRMAMPLFCSVKAIDADQIAMIRQFVPAAFAGILMSGAMVIDQTMAATLTTGSVSSLSFGTKLTAVVAGVVVLAITTVSLPFFSRLISNREWHKLRRSLAPGAIAVTAVTVAVTVAIWTQSERIVQALFERGQFTAADTAIVSGIQGSAFASDSVLCAWYGCISTDCGDGGDASTCDRRGA